MKTRASNLVRSVSLLCLAAWASVPTAEAQTPLVLDVQIYAGLTITGAVGTVYSMEYVTDLAQTNNPSAWRCLEYLQLPASPYLWADKSFPATVRIRNNLTENSVSKCLHIEKHFSITWRMILRAIANVLRKRLADYPAVALDGPRQSGKTTLARSLGGRYFDLEQEPDRTKLDIMWPQVVAGTELTILDEAQQRHRPPARAAEGIRL